METLLSVSRAARLVNVPRGVLQQRIKNEELPTFEGKVACSDLLRVYPNVQLEDNSMVEKVERFKAEAKRGKANAMPADVLGSRLTELSQELVLTKGQLDHYVEIAEKIAKKLNDIKQISDSNLRDSIDNLQNWLSKKIAYSSSDEISAQTQLQVKNTILRVMAAQVRIVPSNHEFFVEGASTILDAALSSGLGLNYGCSNGECGLCKAKVLSGKVQKIREQNYAIDEVEAKEGYVLTCCNTAITDVVIEAGELSSLLDVPLQQTVGWFKKSQDFTEDLLLLHLQTPRTQCLRFLAGQYVTIRLDNGASANYFIASCPCDSRELQFHIQKTSDNPFVDSIFNDLKSQKNFFIEGPKGNFVLNEDSSNPALFIAYENGFGPIKSLIEHAFALDMVESINLYWFANDEKSHYLSNLCRSWADVLDNFKYALLTANTQNVELQAKNTLDSIVETDGNLNGFDVYIAGPKAFVQTFENAIRQRFPSVRLRKGYLEKGCAV